MVVRRRIHPLQIVLINHIVYILVVQIHFGFKCFLYIFCFLTCRLEQQEKQGDMEGVESMDWWARNGNFRSCPHIKAHSNNDQGDYLMHIKSTLFSICMSIQ